MAQPDLSEFEQYDRQHKRKPCKVAAALEGLNATDRTNLEAAFEASKQAISCSAIQRWFQARDREISASAVISHRNGRCACHG